MNTKFTPTRIIEILDGNGTDRIKLTRNPLLKVEALKIEDSSISIDGLDIDKGSGYIRLNGNGESSVFTSDHRNVHVKYLYALMEDSSTTTTTTAAASAGSSVELSVSSSSGFSANDWVYIIGLDGHEEIAQVSSVSTGKITVDSLTLSHESGSIITKQQIPTYIKRLMEIEAAIYVAIYAIGGTYAFNTSFSIAELSVNKGEPYPQWREVIQRCINERDRRMKEIRPRPAIGWI